MNLTDLKINKLNLQLSDIQNFTAVAAVNNAYTFDMQNRAIKNFTIETTDINAKTIAFINVPVGILCQITVITKYTNACSITRPASVSWQNGIVPVFTAGKTYITNYISSDGGNTWLASSIGAW